MTASAIFEPPGPDGQSAIGDNIGLFSSSLALSLLSMAYGIFVAVCQMDEFEDDDDQPKRTKGKQGQIFVCVLINATWSIMAMGYTYGSDLGIARYIFPFLMFALFFVIWGIPMSLAIACVDADDHKWYESAGIFLLVTFVCTIMSFETCAVDSGILFPAGFVHELKKQHKGLKPQSSELKP